MCDSRIELKKYFLVLVGAGVINTAKLKTHYWETHESVKYKIFDSTGTAHSSDFRTASTPPSANTAPGNRRSRTPGAVTAPLVPASRSHSASR